VIREPPEPLLWPDGPEPFRRRSEHRCRGSSVQNRKVLRAQTFFSFQESFGSKTAL